MKKGFLTMLAAFFSVVTLFGQSKNADLSGTYTGKIKYVAGKNAYLMDEYKLDYNYKVVMGDPVCLANLTWTRNNTYTVNKKTVSYAKLSEYQDLKARFDMLVPDSVTLTYTILLYSDQKNAYVGSAKTSITIPYIEKAGVSSAPVVPNKLSWLNSFSDVVIGKQTKDKPGVVIPDAALDKAFEADRLKAGKLSKSEKYYAFKVRALFNISSKIEITNVTANVKWNNADYDYISEEFNCREAFAAQYAAGNKTKAVDSYFANRKYSPAIRTESVLFWNTTVPPTDTWMNMIEEGEKLYAAGKYEESVAYYQMAAKSATNLSYPSARVEKIKLYMEHKNNRNVGDLEFVYVEGKNGMKSFYISKTEITQSQWRRIMRTSPSAFKGRNYPVENVSWEDAIAFIKELNRETGMNYRLPRMEEWEYAANGGAKGTKSEYSGGNNLSDVAWCAYNSNEQTHEVATKTPNELGIYDMTGNVAEWVVDVYDKETRFIKGGAWSDDASGCVITKGEKMPIKYKSNGIGFRVCQDE